MRRPETLAAADPALVRRWLAMPQIVRQADYAKLQAVIPELRADLLDALPLYREAANVADHGTAPAKLAALRT